VLKNFRNVTTIVWRKLRFKNRSLVLFIALYDTGLSFDENFRKGLYNLHLVINKNNFIEIIWKNDLYGFGNKKISKVK
jgi:hypothetical protein